MTISGAGIKKEATEIPTKTCGLAGTTMVQARTGPSVNRHRSKQDYETPAEFIRAIVGRFGPLEVDLAATLENRKAPNFFSERNSGLLALWSAFRGNLWLNPPYADIAPWAEKCAYETGLGAKILFLVPASVDSNWWANWVHHEAAVLFLSPRLCFGGKNPYPKPCALCCYGFGFGLHDLQNWYQPWRWK